MAEPKTFDRLRANRAAFRPEVHTGQSLLREADASQEAGFGAGFGMANDFAIGARALDVWQEERGPYDPDFQPGTFLQESEQYSWLLTAATHDDDLFDVIHDSQNEGDLVAIADRYQSRLDAYEAFSDNKTIGAIGFIAGIALSPSSYLPFGIIKGGQILGLAAKAAKNVRRVSASRLALLEGASQTSIAALEGVSDPSMGFTEIAIQGGAGAALGGALGALLPRAGLVDDLPIVRAEKAFNRKQANAEKVAREASDGEVPVTKSAGAQAAPDESDLHVPRADAARALGSGKGNKIYGFEFMRSIKQRSQNWLTKYEPTSEAGKAVTEFVDMLGRFVRWDQPTKGEELGLTTRRWGVEEIKEHEFRQKLKGDMDTAVRSAWQKLAVDAPELFKKGMNPIVMGQDRLRIRNSWWKPVLSRAEFDFFQAKTMRMLEAGMDPETVTASVIRQNMGELDEATAAKLTKAVDEAIVGRRVFYDEMLRQAKAAGLDEDDIAILGNSYLPQAYDIGRVMGAEKEVIELLMENMRWNPPQEFIDAAAVKFGSDPDGGFDALKVGSKFEDLSQNDKDALRFMINGQMQEQAQDFAEANLKKARKAMKVKKAEGVQAVMEIHAEKINVAQVKVERTKNTLSNKVKNPDKIKTTKAAILRRLKKQEEDLNSLQADMDTARKAMKNFENWQSMLKEATTRGAAKSRTNASKLLKAGQAAKAKVDKGAAKVQSPVELPDLKTLATNMVQNLSKSLNDGESAFGFNMMGHVGTTGKTGRMHPRQINWGMSLARGDGLMDEILINNMDQLAESYIEQVGTRIAIHRNFGTADPSEILEKTVKRLPPEIRDEAMADMNAIMDRSLGRHHLKGTGVYESIRYGANVLKNLTVSTLLGSATFTLAGDVGMTHLSREMAQGAMGRTIRDFVLGLVSPAKKDRVGSTIDVLLKSDKNTLAALMAGARNMANISSRQARMTDIDQIFQGKGLGTPGTALWKAGRLLQAGARNSAEIMMDINLMNHWNARWDMMLRTAHMTNLWDIGKKGFDKADPLLQAAMRSGGIDATKLKRITQLYNEKNVKVGDAILPDIDNWPKDVQMDMIRWVNSRSMNGIIAPGLGDMPRFVNDPLGSLMFQFMGFPYAAQQKMARRMRQRGMNDPLVTQSLMVMLLSSTLGMAARKVSTGRTEDLELDDPKKLTQFVYDVLVRSPMAVAGVGFWSELAINVGGRPANNLLETMGLPQIAPQNSRLRERETLGIFAGAGASVLGGLFQSGTNAAADVASGNFGDAAGRFSHTAPFTSHFLYRGLNAALEND